MKELSYPLQRCTPAERCSVLLNLTKVRINEGIMIITIFKSAPTGNKKLQCTAKTVYLF